MTSQAKSGLNNTLAWAARLVLLYFATLISNNLEVIKELQSEQKLQNAKLIQHEKDISKLDQRQDQFELDANNLKQSVSFLQASIK